MVLDIISSISVACSEAISLAIEGIIEVVVAADNVCVKKESFKKLAEYLNRIVPLLRVLNMKAHCHSQSLYNALEILNKEIQAARELMEECSNRSKLYLLVNCRRVVNRLEQSTGEISNALNLLPLTSFDLSSDITEDVKCLFEDMQRIEFKAAIAEEEIMDKIDIGIQDRKMDRSYANNLLGLIADAVGISKETSSLKKEFEEFKNEIENVRLRKDQAEAVQMDQIIALLETADAASSPQEKETRYLKRRNSLGSQQLDPLQSFYCPITKEVMDDPVETSSGHTFERSAIENWFAGGQKNCPLTLIPLDTAFLRPNRTLRQSIEEWRDRNTIISIASMKQKLDSEDEKEVHHYLDRLQDLCKEKDQHREWVVHENYIPTLVKLLRSKNRNTRNHVLSILYILAKDRDDTKEKIAEVDDAVAAIVCSLGRRIEEGKLAVALLLEISKINLARESIGNSKGCILLLVTMTTNDNSEAAKDARTLLENLSFSDHNVIQMAKANYFEHFLQRLSSGPVDVKMKMAKAIAEMELTDRKKEFLFESGVSASLLSLIISGDSHIKKAVARALNNLSTVPKNGLLMITDGAVGLLLDQLVHHSSSSQGFREELASTIMHMAASTICQESSQVQLSMLESEEETFKLFSFIDLTTPKVQEKILQTFNALCSSPSAQHVKSKLLKCSALQVLSRKFELENPNLRANAMRLFCCLVEDGDKTIILEHMRQNLIENLLRVIQVSDNNEEIASAMGIISSIPERPQITQWLTDAGALPIILSFLQNGKPYNPNTNQVIENAVGAFRQFTAPENQELQKRTAEAGVIPILVELLESGTNLTKQHAATSLARYATSSPRLSKPIPKHKRFHCFMPPPEPGCLIHGGICTIQSSFCLIEADAVRPLVRVLEESDPGACEASLDALLTFLGDENLQTGIKVLADANAIHSIVRFLSSRSPTLQEKALKGLERIFQLAEFKKQYGPKAQMPLIELTQQGNRHIKSRAARVLAQLDVLGNQSSFF